MFPPTEPAHPPEYEIRIRGHLAPHWQHWFDAMTITPEPNGDTILTGTVIDQAALHGLLRKLRDLGLPLLSITQLAPEHDDSGATT